MYKVIFYVVGCCLDFMSKNNTYMLVHQKDNFYHSFILPTLSDVLYVQDV